MAFQKLGALRCAASLCLLAKDEQSSQYKQDTEVSEGREKGEGGFVSGRGASDAVFVKPSK